MMKLKLFFLLFLLLSLKKAAPLYLLDLKTQAEFKMLASEPLTNKYSEVQSVKVVYDIETDKMYYINSAYYKFHYEFCQAQIDGDIYLGKFNVDNYAADSPDRRYLLANVNYFSNLDTYAVELSPSDYMVVAQIEFFLQKIQTSSFFKSKLALMLSTARLQSLASCFLRPINLLTPEEIYGKMKFQVVSEGHAVGQLRFIENLKEEVSTLSPTDIIVIKETPLVLPRVAGVIIQEFQTPLSHLTILGRNRKMPALAFRNVFSDSSLLALKGKQVELLISSATYSLVETSKKSKLNDKNKSKIKLTCDLDINQLVSFDEYQKNASDFIGNKAANFGLLVHLSKKAKFLTPESAFAIPFSFYNRHMHQSHAQELVDELLVHSSWLENQDTLKQKLKVIRAKIKAEEVEVQLISRVSQKADSLGDFNRLRFRSSTNAEDADGFSGAGLYASKTGILNSETKTVEKAIQKVWASLWSYEAFMEREYFNIDQTYVQMGILVHRSFPNEEVNGVIITKNLYRPGYLGFVVNAQLKNESVVKPSPGVTCDQFICYPETSVNIQPEETVIDVITRSSLNKGRLVMTTEEIQTLADEVYFIKTEWYKKFGRKYIFENFGLDLEFKLDHLTRQLYIKQVRIYND